MRSEEAIREQLRIKRQDLKDHVASGDMRDAACASRMRQRAVIAALEWVLEEES